MYCSFIALGFSPPFFPKKKRRAAIECFDDDIVNSEAMENFEASLSCDEDVLIETVAEKVEVLRNLAKYYILLQEYERSRETQVAPVRETSGVHFGCGNTLE